MDYTSLDALTRLEEATRALEGARRAVYGDAPTGEAIVEWRVELSRLDREIANTRGEYNRQLQDMAQEYRYSDRFTSETRPDLDKVLDDIERQSDAQVDQRRVDELREIYEAQARENIESRLEDKRLEEAQEEDRRAREEEESRSNEREEARRRSERLLRRGASLDSEELPTLTLAVAEASDLEFPTQATPAQPVSENRSKEV